METQISEITEILEDKEVTRNSQRNHPKMAVSIPNTMQHSHEKL